MQQQHTQTPDQGKNPVAAAEDAALLSTDIEDEAYRRFEEAREQWLAARRASDEAWGRWAMARERAEMA